MRPHAGDEERLVYQVIAAFYEVYNRLEFGFFESVYANALEVELKSRGHTVEREVAVCVSYKQHAVGRQRLDMVVDGCLIVETKASQDLPKSAMRQVYSYLRGTALEQGLLLHFGPKARFYRLRCSHQDHPVP